MDLESYRAKIAEAGPHPGLSGWHRDNILLYRCRDIDEAEFRRRYLSLAEKFERLLEQSLPENLSEETYQMSSGYYNAVADCLDAYLEGIDETLHWSESGEEASLETSRRCFERADRRWNKALSEALESEAQFQEIDEALMRSLGIGPAGY